VVTKSVTAVFPSCEGTETSCDLRVGDRRGLNRRRHKACEGTETGVGVGVDGVVWLVDRRRHKACEGTETYYDN